MSADVMFVDVASNRMLLHADRISDSYFSGVGSAVELLNVTVDEPSAPAEIVIFAVLPRVTVPPVAVRVIDPRVCLAKKINPGSGDSRTSASVKNTRVLGNPEDDDVGDCSTEK